MRLYHINTVLVYERERDPEAVREEAKTEPVFCDLAGDADPKENTKGPQFVLPGGSCYGFQSMA
jgi:hypothetical protein